MTYLKNWYGEAASGGGEEEEAATSVYQLYDRRVEDIALARPHKALSQIEIEFRGDDNALFDPTACNLTVRIENENPR